MHKEVVKYQPRSAAAEFLLIIVLVFGTFIMLTLMQAGFAAYGLPGSTLVAAALLCVLGFFLIKGRVLQYGLGFSGGRLTITRILGRRETVQAIIDAREAEGFGPYDKKGVHRGKKTERYVIGSARGKEYALVTRRGEKTVCVVFQPSAALVKLIESERL